MSVLTAMFLWTFLAIYSVIYPIFKRPIFATYVMILALIAFGTYRMYGVVRGSSLAVKGVKAKVKVVVTWAVFAYLLLMMVWFVFVHFKTYTIM